MLSFSFMNSSIKNTMAHIYMEDTYQNAGNQYLEK